MDINKLSAKILEVETILSDADIYTNYPDKFLKLIHPLDHNFYEACRNKLGWGIGIIEN